MHCVDCHFEQDSHGNGKLYGETRNAVEIDCVDCHGTDRRARDARSRAGPAAPDGGTDARARCARRGGERALRLAAATSSTSARWSRPDLEWEVVAGRSTRSRRAAPHYNEKSRLAKTIQTDGKTWGARRRRRQARARRTADDLLRLPLVVDPELLRLPPVDEGEPEDADAAQRRADDAQLTSYNFQILRDDVFMLGRTAP